MTDTDSDTADEVNQDDEGSSISNHDDEELSVSNHDDEELSVSIQDDEEPSVSDQDEEEPSVFYDVQEGDTDVTQGRTITEADVVNFAGVSGDFNHLHTDEERMGESMFGERIAHGMLVLSVGTGLLWQARSREERNSVVAFYGIDELRFRQPVYIGDTVRLETEVLETREKEEGPGNGTVRYAVEMKNQRDQVVVSCQMTSLLR